MPTTSTSITASAPGKVLITGGYLILEPPLSGLVLSTTARFFSTVEWVARSDEAVAAGGSGAGAESREATGGAGEQVKHDGAEGAGGAVGHSGARLTAASVAAAGRSGHARERMDVEVVSPQFRSTRHYQVWLESAEGRVIAAPS